ncbi:carboxyl-terminal processing protease [Nonlabens sp. Hel1_33_55]|uniref:carboxy terminal-processing peptidase n=1 Tax=Nonlabens sp. Hel1_33_55 TaxID=1336802 RepID=UPI000875CB3F|nr:carboxy terminal-processing peptidase [Nonlabens sp. Hel1_33_55]SCY44333.1 carboxyl-terminal processing protease [Nonlabens sp. Hel1_33_55]
MRFLKNNIAIGIITLMVATASCSFINNDIDPGDKEKEELLIELINHVLRRNHYEPADLTDQFSQDVFKNFVYELDPAKRYFLASDYEDFKTFEFLIDDQIRDGRVDMFNIVYERLLKREKESEKIFKEVINEPFDFTVEEEIDTDYEEIAYAKNRKELKNHWRKLLKLSAIGIYNGKIEAQEGKSKTVDDNDEASAFNNASQNSDPKTPFKKKSLAELEKEARMEVKKSMEENFDLSDDVERLDYFALFLNNITTHFDPHTNYFAPQTKDRFDTSLSGSLEGIGARLQKKMDDIEIMEIISGGPAWTSGKLEKGDQILRVAQDKDTVATSIVGMRISDAVDLIKGPKGTKVTLTLKKVDGNIKDVTLVRDVVLIEETFAKTALLQDDSINYGVINLPKFYFNQENNAGRAAGDDVAKEIVKLKEEGMEGLIIDLRNNGGGSLREVIEMAGLFIPEGPMVQVGLKGNRTQTLNDDDGGAVLWDGPLVILVNELSASASEILAAALQDYDRAIVLGSKQTFGKGTVQNFEDLNRYVKSSEFGDLGALKLTTQKFYRINGGSTQLEGVKSDVIAPDRYSYIEIGERDEDYPLAYDEIPAADYKKFKGYLNLKESIKSSQDRINNNEYFQLIDKNAKWLANQRDERMIPLSIDSYKKRLKRLEEETDQFNKLDEYKNDLAVYSLKDEKVLIEADSSLADKRKRWHNSINEDMYIEEAVNVLKDLKTNTIKGNGMTIKN